MCVYVYIYIYIYTHMHIHIARTCRTHWRRVARPRKASPCTQNLISTLTATFCLTLIVNDDSVHLNVDTVRGSFI